MQASILMGWIDRRTRRMGIALLRLLLPAAIFSWPTGSASAATVTFDFDTGTPTLSTGQGIPLDQTADGLTAHVSSPQGSVFSIQTDASTQFRLSQFSGHYVYDNNLNRNFLDVSFSQPVDSITLTFATADFQQVEVPTTIQLTAYQGATGTQPVGTATAHGVYGGDTMPMGTLSFNSSAQPFDVVEILIPFQPLGASDFLVDNIIVTTSSVATATPTATTTQTETLTPADTQTSTPTATPTSTPTATGITATPALCSSAPEAGCLTSAKSILQLTRSPDPSNDKLLWKWIRGDSLTQTAFADPMTSARYALCVYAGATNALIAAAALPPGAGWSAIGDKGYKFKGTSPDGLSLAILKGGAVGRSKALAKGKGAALPDPTLPLIYAVTVQLEKDGSPLCLESVFTSADEKKNTDTQFKAKR